MTYIIITFAVLLVLNIYCSQVSQQLFNRSKEESMLEKCYLAADEIADLDIINTSTVTALAQQLDVLSSTRMIVTDHQGLALYDSHGTAGGTYVLLPEIVDALTTDLSRAPMGHNAFSWVYRGGTTHSRAATPIVYYGTIIGCVYLTDYETAHGALIRSLEINVLQITMALELILVLFSLFYSSIFSQRIRRIMQSMRVIQRGEYSHKVDMGGSDELTLLGREFNNLTERLQASEQTRRRFVSDASHELKTPLASIKLLSDSILQNDMDMDTVREFVNDIGNEAERLNRMTGKLLALTKMDVQLPQESQIIYIGSTIRRVARMLSPLAKESGIGLEFDLQGDSPILILEDDLYQIIFNLMENGIKYNKPGGKLFVTLRRQEEDACLTIRDTGVGIPEDALDNIFERFYRVDKARSRASGGSGLGLAIVQGIVERNRGHITVESTLGQGTTFAVTFPIFDTEVDKE